MDLLDRISIDEALDANNRATRRLMLLGRVLAWTVFALGIGTLVLEQQLSSQFYSLTGALLAYPILTHFLLFPLGEDRQQLVINVSDAGIFGGLIVFLGGSAIPSLLLLILLNTTLILSRNLTTYVFGIAFALVGASISYILFPEHLIPNATRNHYLEYVIAIGLALYVTAIVLISNLQARALTEFRNKVAERNRMYHELSQKLAKYLSPQVWKTIFSGQREVRLETQRKKLVVFFSDIRGFTELSEIMEPEALTEMLNTYFTDMSEIALRYGGTIDKFVGDSIMIFFGDPETKGTKKDAEACVSMAIEMRKHMRTLQARWRKLGSQRPLEIRMGINTGYCTVGNFGAEQRMDYTIIGKEVNLASRLESAADPGEILISHETYSLTKDRILARPKEPIMAKGFSRPVQVYKVINYRHEMGGKQTFAEMEADGFSIHLDLDQITIRDKERIMDALEKARDVISDRVV